MFVVTLPTAAEEFVRIKDTLERRTWFNENNYTPTLPPLEVIAAFDTKGAAEAEALFIKKYFKPSDYTAAQRGLVEAVSYLKEIPDIFKALNGAWGFKLYPEIKIRPTLYGMGGSYYPKSGEITLKVTTTGLIKSPAIAARIIYHEAIHLGIEELIVEPLSLSQNEKETVVDAIGQCFWEEYPVQARIIPELMEKLTTEAVKGNLPEVIKSYKI